MWSLLLYLSQKQNVFHLLNERANLYGLYSLRPSVNVHTLEAPRPFLSSIANWLFIIWWHAGGLAEFITQLVTPSYMVSLCKYN